MKLIGANNDELSQISFPAMSFNNLWYLFIALLMKYEKSSLTKKKSFTKIEPINPEKWLNGSCCKTFLIKIKAPG